MSVKRPKSKTTLELKPDPRAVEDTRSYRAGRYLHDAMAALAARRATCPASADLCGGPCEFSGELKFCADCPIPSLAIAKPNPETAESVMDHQYADPDVEPVIDQQVEDKPSESSDEVF